MWCEALLNGTPPPSAACTKKHVAPRVLGFAPAGTANSQRGQRARDTAWDTALLRFFSPVRTHLPQGCAVDGW